MHSKLTLIIAPLLAVLIGYGASPDLSRYTHQTSGGPPPTTGFTGGTTGTPTGVVNEGCTVEISDIKEHKSASTYGYFSGSWQTLTGRHTVGVNFRVYPYTGVTQSDPHVVKVTHTESLYVEQGTEMGVPSGYSGSGTSYSGTPVGGFQTSTSSGYDILIQTSDTGPIESGRVLTYWKHTIDVIEYDDGRPNGGGESWARYQIELLKLPCADASVDSRKTYGQPNAEGELPADPNAMLRGVNFGSWIYKGGLFLGNMPASGKDASGTARTQLTLSTTGITSYGIASLSLFDMGKPSISGLSGAVPVGVYLPGSSDPNYSVSENNVTWETKWNITPNVHGYSSNPYESAIYWKTLTDGNSDDYISFPLGTLLAANSSLQGICLAIEGESSYTGYALWHYFASKEHEDSEKAFPRNDCAPRVWVARTYTP